MSSQPSKFAKAGVVQRLPTRQASAISLAPHVTAMSARRMRCTPTAKNNNRVYQRVLLFKMLPSVTCS